MTTLTDPVEAPALATPMVLQKRTQEMVLCPACSKCQMNTMGAKNHFMPGLLNGQVLDEVPPDHPEGYILVLGKAPDLQSDEANSHTASRDYEFLRKMFHNLGISDRVWWQTSMRCFVPKAKAVLPTKGQLAQCKKHLEHDISVIKPKAIIALGADASASACGRRDVMAIAGQKVMRTDGIPVFPLWSLGYAMREPNRLLPEWGKMWEDVVNKIDGKNLGYAADRIQPVIAWSAKIAEIWFTQMIQGMKENDTLRVEPMAWDMETRGNKQWSDLFRIGLIAFYHEACEQPLIIPVDHEEVLARYAAYVDKYGEEDDSLAPTWSMERRKLLDLVKTIMTNKKVKKTGHNVKFDENGLKAVEGYEVAGFVDDTMNLAYCYNPNRQGHYGLDNLCREMLSLPDYWLEVHAFQAKPENARARWDFTIIPWDMLAVYAAWDVFATYLVRKEVLRRLHKQKEEGYGSWFILTDGLGNPRRNTLSTLDYAKKGRKIHHRVTAIMEQNGQAVDEEVIDAVSTYYRQQAQLKESELLAHPDLISYGKPINWGSPVQVRDFFCNHLKLPVVHETGKGDASTDAYALSVWATDHNCTVAKLLVSFREANKFLGTYIEPLRAEDSQERLLQGDRMIHPNFKTHSTRSGRLSCANPNSQNMPRRGLIKRLYYSRFKNGWIIQRDYSGLEVRVLALLSRDPGLINIYRTGGDVHMQTQRHFFADKANKKDKDQRSICKSSLFGNIYGQGDKGLFDLLTKAKVKSPSRVDLEGNPMPISLEECSEFNRKIKEAYPGVASYIDHCHLAARKFKWCSTAFGFVRPLPEMEFYDHWNNNLRHTQWGTPTEVDVRIGIGNAERQSVNCVDAETEILTQAGWQRYDEVEAGTWILTRNLQSGALEWNQIKKLCVFPEFRGDLIEFKSRTFSALTTTDHRWQVTRRKKSRKGYSREEIFTTSVEVDLNGYDGIHRTGQYVLPDNPAFSDDFLELCGWVLSDGGIQLNTSGKTHKAYVCQSKPENFERIDALVRRLGVLRRLHTSKAGENFWWLNIATANRLAALFPGRVLSNAFMPTLSQRQARLVIEAMLLGDGDNGKTEKRRRLTTSKKSAADAFQMLCVIAGYATTARYRDMSGYTPKLSAKMRNVPKMTGCWLVTILARPKVQVTPKQRRVLKDVEKLVWCPQVENQSFVARRNGCVYVTGNTPIQGTAGDLTVFSAYMIHRALRKRKMKSLLVNCVHDSIYVDTVDEEVEEVNAIMADIMDNSQVWLPTLLPGFDSSWMDIPIIGECEVGLDAKDVLGVAEECSLADSSKVLRLKNPTDDDGQKLIEGPDLLTWKEHKEAIREYLTPLRAQNMWHRVAEVSMVTGAAA